MLLSRMLLFMQDARVNNLLEGTGKEGCCEAICLFIKDARAIKLS